jgi:hypothetical protein
LGGGKKTGKTENKQLKISIFFVISAVAVIKSKYRPKVIVENQMHVAVSKMLNVLSTIS